jgi:hypothetical protein
MAGVADNLAAGFSHGIAPLVAVLDVFHPGLAGGHPLVHGCGPPEASGVVTSNRTRAPDQGALGAYERGRFPRAVSSARAQGRVTLIVIL